MQFKLTQNNKTIDTATLIDRLKFSKLNGSEPWYIFIVWSDREDCIASVDWTDAPGYTWHFEYYDYPYDYITMHKEEIIPDVFFLLGEVYLLGGIQKKHKINPILIVKPVMES